MSKGMKKIYFYFYFYDGIRCTKLGREEGRKVSKAKKLGW